MPETKPQAPTTQGKHSVPWQAFRQERLEVKFADNAPADAEATTENSTNGGLPRGKFSMLARTGNPIVHWYWGQIAHDMAGFAAHKATIPVDYCHDGEPIGYADQQVATPDGLTCSGELIAFSAEDKAAEILFKGAAGVPYEASIDWDYTRLEYIEVGVTVPVNGQNFVGPGYIVREWTCRSIAICQSGADGDTETAFGKDAPPDRPSSRDVLLFSATGGITVTDPKPGTQTSTDDPRQSILAELTKFTSKFGADNGAKWFTEGKTYEQSLELHIDEQGKKFAALQQQLTEANQKLAAIPKGEKEPVSFGDGKETNGQPVGKLSKAASQIKMPD